VTASLVLDALLCLLLVATALTAVLGRDLFAAIVLFIIYGLFVAIGWVRLGAVDVALAEAAIGAGLSGVLLVRAAGRVGGFAVGSIGLPDGRMSFHSLFPAIPCLGVAGALAWIVLDPAAVGIGLRGEVADALPATGLANPVTGVLLVFRGYDTLLEAVVLLVALVGVWSLTPDRFWGGAPGLREHARPEGVLASFGRLLPPVGATIGIYLFWVGADAPGGAFQAGTILAAVWVLVVMAGHSDVPPVGSLRLRFAVLVGPLAFLVLASAGLVAGAFLAYPPAFAKATVLAIEAALTLSIAVTLALLVMGPPRRVE
jgi:multisubunit Na+/H+ antiporter MnhB subunit